MPDLEKQIAEWRGQMQAAGLKTPEALEELESHLRDDVEQQMRSGLNAERAFETAALRIGEVGMLKSEFSKIGRITGARAEHVLLTLAGIPNQLLVTNMNTSHPSTTLEPRWATYLKAAVFLLPAVSLWTLAVVVAVPKLKQICHEAGVAMPAIFRITEFVTDNTVVICGGLILALALLEWRSRTWPRYRRASIGIGVFLLNSTVLVLISLMVVLALVAAPALSQHAR